MTLFDKKLLFLVCGIVYVCLSAYFLPTFMTCVLKSGDNNSSSKAIHRLNVAIFSLVSSNSSFYYAQTVLLYRSMHKFFAEQRLHLLVTDDVDPVIMENLEAFATIHVISPYVNEPKRPDPNDTHISKFHASWIHQLSKIKLWSLNVTEPYICYLDSDLIFFGHTALQDVVSECMDALNASNNIEWCGFDNEDPNGNDSHWEMKTIQANFFCLKPDMGLARRMEQELVWPMTHGQMMYKGKYVATEQDILNLFFNGRIHFVPKTKKRGFYHSDWNWIRWALWDLGFDALFVSSEC